MCATCGCGKKTAKKMSPKQANLAAAANPKNKITGADFKALKSAKGNKTTMNRKKGM